MKTEKPRRNRVGQRRWGAFHVDGLLLIFLLVGWFLIFGSATLGLQRSSEGWLPLQLVSRISADYSVESREAPRFAPVRAEVIEAVKKDALAARLSPSPTRPDAPTATPGSLAMLIFGRTPTPTPSPTPTPFPLEASAGGPYTGQEGSPIHLAAQGSGGGITYRWDLDEDGQFDDAQGMSTTIVFGDDGEYSVSVQAIDALGQVTEDSATVSVSNVAPAVDAGGDKSASEGQRVSFSATASDPGDDPLVYTWDFGDGVGAKDTLQPEHTYANNGDYRVALVVEDGDGGVGEASFVVHVDNVPPSADAGSDREINQGDTVTFSGAASDPGVLDTLSYAWDFDYDGATFTVDDSGPTVSHQYSTGVGTRTAALRVDDGDGSQVIDTADVLIANIPPAIDSVSNDGPGSEGSPVTLVVSANDAGGDALAYAYDWGNDGEFEDVNQTETATHIWADDGNYTVGIRVADGMAETHTTTPVVVNNLPPVADAGAPVATFEGRSVTFNGAASHDPGILDVLTYEWSFGDGSPIANADIVDHTYADNGAYGVTLTVRDDSDAVSTDAVSVTILNASPVVDIRPVETVREGEQFDFVATASDPGAGDTWQSLEWDFNYDGTDFTVDRSGATSADWTYRDGPATRVVAFRARDDDYPCPSDRCSGESGEGIDTLQITVNNVAPTDVNAGGPYSGRPGQHISLEGTANDVPADLPDLVYEWDLDGGRVIRPWDGQNIIASWNLTGTYTVTLRVDDQDGGVRSDTALVRINNPPTADAGGPYAGTEAIPITLDGTASDPDRDPITYTWNFGDGDGATGTLQPQHTYVDSGVYTATLRVVDIWGAVATDTARVDIAANGAPTANTGGPYTGTEGNSIRLRGTADDPEGDPLTYEWNLGDGSPVADTLAVDHTYADNGVYTAILRVVDIWGGTAIDTTAVTIDNQAPVADTGGPYTTMVDTPLTLRGSASDVPADALIYTWDLNNDGTFETPGQDVVFTSALTGTFRVVLRVDDDDGGFGEAETTVEVNTLAPVTGLGGAYLLARARQVILRRRRSTRKFKYTKHDEGKTNGCSV